MGIRQSQGLQDTGGKLQCWLLFLQGQILYSLSQRVVPRPNMSALPIFHQKSEVWISMLTLEIFRCYSLMQFFFFNDEDCISQDCLGYTVFTHDPIFSAYSRRLFLLKIQSHQRSVIFLLHIMFSLGLRLTKILLSRILVNSWQKKKKEILVYSLLCTETIYLNQTLKFLSEILHRGDSAHISFAKTSHMAKADHINGK